WARPSLQLLWRYHGGDLSRHTPQNGGVQPRAEQADDDLAAATTERVERQIRPSAGVFAGAGGERMQLECRLAEHDGARWGRVSLRDLERAVEDSACAQIADQDGK